MNILQILPELNVGGGETGTLDLARYLVRSGHKAVVVSSGGELVGQLQSCGAIHYQIPVHKKSLFTVLKAVPKLVEVIKKEEIDIVHARSRVPGWIAYFACRRTGAVFVTTCHGYYSKHIFSEVMGWGRRVIVASKIVGRHMTEDFKVPAERIRLIPRGVDLDKFKYISPDKKRRNGEFNVGIIGRITPLKGHIYFIKAMAKLSQILPGLKVWIVGDAPSSKRAYKEKLKSLVNELGLSQRAEFLGTRRDIPEILSKLDLLVMATTTQEAFGRVIVEAQASGVPVVATKVGGVVDIIEDGRTGLLVPPADPDAISGAAVKIFKDTSLSRDLAESAYSKAKEKYNLELMAKNTVEVYKEVSASPKILVMKFTTVGDMVLATPALRAIREKFKGSHIVVLASKESKDVISRCPYIDKTPVYDLKDREKSVGGFLKVAGVLRKESFDMVIDLQNNRKSHMLSFLSGAKARYGYDNGKYGFLLNRRMKDTKPSVDPVAHQFKMLGMLKIYLNDPRPELWPTEDDRRHVEKFLNSQGVNDAQKLIGMNVAASSRWVTKNWPLSHMARLCGELYQRGIRVVITGMEKDLEDGRKLTALASGADIIDACGKTTVNQLACLIRRCDVYISPDSAPLHIAASQGTPFVALFGPTDSKRHLPPADDYAVIQKEMPCGPCYDSKCKTRICMESITPEEVLAAVDKLLK